MSCITCSFSIPRNHCYIHYKTL